jgi:Fe2+ transport system protein FeoA
MMIGAPSVAMKFTEVRKGMRARVTKIHSTKSDLLRRLQEMGLTEGTEFVVNKVAPFGDPVEISLRGYRLCLRKRETQDVEIEAVE